METPPPPTPPPVSQPAQTQPKERTVGETLNTWMQIVGILIAAVWGIYTFFYKEVFVPKSAPVNISINLQLKKVGTGSASQASLAAVQMDVSATNPSTREIQLLPSAWIAHGIRIRTTERNDADLGKATADALRDPNVVYTVERHAIDQESLIVAGGFLFADSALKPNEKLTRTIIFHVPKEGYDLLAVNAVIPSAEDLSQIQLEWTLKDKDLEPTFYRVDKKGNRSRMQTSEVLADKRSKVQWTEGASQVSLWP
jgi:hypothetical protein